MEKRGQVTLFVLLGVVVLGIIVLAVVLNSDILQKPELEKEKKLSLEESKVKGLVDGCIKYHSENGLLLLAGQGGEIYLDVENTALFYNYVVSVYSKNSSKFVKVADMEKHMEYKLNFEVPRCLMASNLSSRSAKTNVVMRKGGVDINIDMPVYWGINGSRKMEKFFVRVPVDFLKVHSEAEIAFDNMISKNKNIFDMLLSSNKGNYTLGVETSPKITFYSLIFNGIVLDNETLRFNLAIENEII